MKMMLAVATAALLSFSAAAQDDDADQGTTSSAPAAPSGTVWTNMDGRFYVSPMLNYTFVDSGRNVDHALGGSLAVGKAFGLFGYELFAQYSKADHESGSGEAEVNSLGVNVLFFPSKKQPGYVLLGAGYGDVKDHPGGVADYNPLMLNMGAGYLWQPFKQWVPRLLLRTEAVYRLDAHGNDRTGETVGNGRKAFNDVLVNVGLAVPLGETPAPMVAPPVIEEPVEVVAVLDADGDGVPDETDQCPDSATGASVNADGCPAEVAEAAPAAEPAAACAAYEADTTFDVASCKVGDVLLLKGVNFDSNQARLTAEAQSALSGVAAALASVSASVEIAGHTDSQGSETLNQRLSQRRACAVAQQLTAQGVAADRLSPVGYGGSQAVAENDTAEGRAQNRRVELKVIDAPASGMAACEQPVASVPAAAPLTDLGGSSVGEALAEPSVSEPEPAQPEAQAALEPPPSSDEVPVPVSEAAPVPAASSSTSDPASPSIQMVPEEEVFGR